MPPSPLETLRRAAALYEARRFEEAAELCETLLALPAPPRDAFHLAGLVAFERKEHARSIMLLRKALAAGIETPVLHGNLAICLATTGEISNALNHAAVAVRMAPHSPEAQAALADVYFSMGGVGGAVTHLRAALKLDPSPPIHSNLLYYMNFLSGYRPGELADEHRAFGRAYADPMTPLPPPTNSKDPERKLRIGYLSADMYSHSVAHFLAPLLEAHDRSRHEIHLFPSVKRPDAVTERLRGLSDVFTSVLDLDDLGAARAIRNANIDVLVELGGHTGNSRLLVLAHKPAPVQVSWLGYPNTTGVSAVGYRLTDSLVDPEGDADKHHVESLYRLPDGFLCYEPPAGTPDVAPPPSLARGHITFGSFNTLAKVSPKVIELWVRILKKTPGSRMYMKSAALTDPGVRAHVTKQFVDQGLEENRLTLEGRTPGQLGHLERYAEIDIALDPFPYNGTTTTCEALTMGVPVVALDGDRHASRVSASLLMRLGLASLVGATPKHYQSIAIALASNPARLAELRAGMRERIASSPLANKSAFARQVEAAYRTMWSAWCSA